MFSNHSYRPEFDQCRSFFRPLNAGLPSSAPYEGTDTFVLSNIKCEGELLHARQIATCIAGVLRKTCLVDTGASAASGDEWHDRASKYRERQRFQKGHSEFSEVGDRGRVGCATVHGLRYRKGCPHPSLPSCSPVPCGELHTKARRGSE